jgi:Ca-activated chloride channel homolog
MWFSGLDPKRLVLLAVSVVTATAILYLLRLRRRSLRVAFLPLWQRVLSEHDASRLLSRLRRILSWLLNTALALMLVLAMGEPRTYPPSNRRHLVVLVDTSASMLAVFGAGTRLEHARTELDKLIDGLGDDDQMMIAQLAQTVLPLSTMSSDRAVLRSAASELQGVHTGADLRAGIQFGLDVLAGKSEPEILVISDGAYRQELTELEARMNQDKVRLSYVPVGTDLPNVAISAFSVRRYPLDKSRYEVMLELSNHSDAGQTTRVTIAGDGLPIEVSQIHLAPREVLLRFYDNLGGGNETLEASITVEGNSDHLSVDNHAFALLPERRRSKVLAISPGNTYLEAALLLDEYLDVTLIAPGETLPHDAFDVLVIDGVDIDLGRTPGARLYLNPTKKTTPVSLGRALTEFGFDTWNRKSPLLSFIAPENIQVMTGNALQPQPGDQVIGASELGPFLLEGTRDNYHFVALGFDPRNSDMVLRVAWPLFLLNCVQHLAQRDGSDYSSFATGDVWRLPVQASSASLLLRGPTGTRTVHPSQAGVLTYVGETAGFYEILDQRENRLYRFAANLNDARESELRVEPHLTLGSHTSERPAGFRPHTRREWWAILVLVALVMWVLEWFSYHRRVTV